jgi:uncharacterized protein YceK
MRSIYLSIFALLLSGCTTYQNQNIVGKKFPSVYGQNLEQKTLQLPNDFKGKQTLLLIAYKHKSQFDVDRWLIGLDMTETKVDAYEIPTLKGMFPEMFRPFIDNGMRKGIPKELWKGVVTVYGDGEAVQSFTGNENPTNARVVLIDKQGVVTYFYDRGFSVSALNELRTVIEENQP